MVEIIIKGKAKIPEGTLGDFARPNHPDFMTTAEIKKSKFTGIRHNSLLDHIEIWTVGDLRASHRMGDLEAFAKSYCDVFAIDLVTFYSEVAPTLKGST